MMLDTNSPFPSHFNRHELHFNDFNQRCEAEFNASNQRFNDQVKASRQRLNTHENNNSLGRTIFKGIIIVAIVAATIFGAMILPHEIKRLHNLIGKDVTYVEYVKTFFGIKKFERTETFTVGTYFANLAALCLASCAVLVFAAMAIQHVIEW